VEDEMNTNRRRWLLSAQDWLVLGMAGAAVTFLIVNIQHTRHIAHEHVERSAARETRLADTFQHALRDYVGERIRPEMLKRTGIDEFVPEAMSTSFVARSVFEKVREEFPDLVTRFPSTNPRNPANQATPAEERIIRYFAQHPEATSWSGVVRLGASEKEHFVRAFPRRMRQSCLRCHGQPADAPASLIERYGATAGFGRSVGDVSIDMAAVPVSSAHAAAKAFTRRHMVFAGGVCLIFLLGTGGLVYLHNVHQRHSQRQVLESRERLAATLQSIGDAVVSTDVQGRVADINPVAEALTGWPAAEASGRLLDEVFHIVNGQTGEPVASPVQHVLQTGQTVDLANDTVLISRDGTERQIADSAAPIRDAKGQIAGVVLVFRDVTQEYRQRMQLCEAKQLFDELAKQSRTVTWEVDSNGLFTYLSPVADDVFGYAGEELVGKVYFYDLHPEAGRETFRQRAMKFLASKSPFKDLEHPVVTKDGRILWVSTNGIPVLDTHGRLLGYRGSDTDVTEQKQAKAALFESEEKHRLLIEHALSGIAVHEIVLDAAGTPVDFVFVDANPAFETHTGLRVVDILGRRATEVLPGIEKTALVDTYGKVVLSGEPISFDQYFRPLGRHFEISAYKISDSCFATVFVDISERRRMEEAVRLSEQNYRTCFESIGDMIVVCTPAGRLLYTNTALQEKLGYTPQQVHDLYFLDLHPTDLQKEAADIFGGMVRGEQTTCSLSWITVSGSLIPVEVRVWPGEWDNQDCLFGIAKDLTFEQEAGQRFERLFRNNPTLMTLFSMSERTFTDVNDAFLTKTGYVRDDVIGKTIDELELFPDSQQPAALADALIQRRGVSEVELQIRCKDGSLLDGLFSGEVIQTQGTEYFLAVVVDVTEQKQAAAKLAQQTRLLQTILDGIPDVIALQDIDHSILSYNAAGYRMLGQPPEKVHGRKCFELLGRRVPCEACATSEAVTTQQVVSRDRFVQETQQWIRATSIPIIDESGHTTMIVEQLQNITEQEQARRKIRDSVRALESANKALEESNQLAESATRAKSEFLANMSHEIRTPMTAILGFAEVLLGEPDLEQAPPQRAESLRTIKRNGEHLLELINDILDLSKIEAGKLDVERTVVSPIQVLQDVISLMEVRATAKGLSLGLEFLGDVPESIQSDPTRLRQVLINLVGNAIKFTETGKVHVVASVVQGPDNSNLLQVDVVDTGIGMSQAQLGRLFQPFSQADSSTTRKFGGTGLGLTISKRLAEALGGDVTVSSTLGKGSTFSVTIEIGSLNGTRWIRNASAPEKPTQATPAQEPVNLERLPCRVLLAEDGPDNQRLIGFMLKKAGAEVTTVENGQLAFEAALSADQAGHPFDVVLMDMQMPIMDGYTATAKLRDAGYVGPIIALTAHAMEGDRQKCLDAGCDDYATKPIHRETFLAIIANWARMCVT
jgi:PAS domain S-box-containing protein